MAWDSATLIGAAIALTGLLSLGWTVASFFLRKDFSDIAALQQCIEKAPRGDPLRNAYRAAIYERLYRVHFPARREGLFFLLLWIWSLLVSFTLTIGDTARHLRALVAPEHTWVLLLGVMVFLGTMMWFANSVSYRFKENLLGQTDELHQKYRALCFEGRKKFLDQTADVKVPTKLSLKEWIDVFLRKQRRQV